MNEEKVERLNFLARKKKAQGLNEEELAEQQVLREEYLKNVRKNLKEQLDHIKIED